MISLQCVLCTKRQKIKELYKENLNLQKINSITFSARRTPDRIHHRFVKCYRCGLIFSNPILPKEKIVNFYKKSTFDYGHESAYLKKTYGYYLKQLLGNSAREKLRLLDIGCGNGFFLEEASDMGIGKVFGVEPGKASVKKAPQWLQKNIKVGLFEKKVYKNNTFDAISCFHTLDHIIEPDVFLEDVYAALKRGGKALFIVHDTDGLSVKLFGEKSPIFDVEHVYLFNRKNLAKLFAKSKFRKIQTFNVKNTYPLIYWFRMVPLPKKIKEVFLSVLISTRLGNLSLSLSAGNIGIIAEK